MLLQDCMKVWKMHQDFMKVWNNASGFYECLKKCIRILWRSKKCIRIVRRSEKMHQDFMKVLKISKQIHLHFASASTTCIKILWRSETAHLHFVSPLQSLQQVANGGLLHEPIARWSAPKCAKPETVVGFHMGVTRAWDAPQLSRFLSRRS